MSRSRYFKGSDDNVNVWDMRPTVFPHGLEAFGQKTEWKYQLHCQKWTPESAYSTRNGGRYHFIHDGSPTVVPDDQSFWDDLLRNKTSDGMVTYEMDWMNDQFTSSKSMLANATLGRTWLMQADRAARKAGVSMQLCMSLCRQILQSVEMASVTNARASNDYHPGNSQWNIGTTAILLLALGVGPSKDSAWSTRAAQSGSHWGDDVREPNTELQSAVLSLSTGPVAASDKIGASNSSLIMRACDTTGRLLTPDAPAREIDAHFAHLAFSSSDSTNTAAAAASCSIERDVDYQGNDVGAARHNITSPAACCDACVATPDCQFFTWLNTPGFRNYCSLKSSNEHRMKAAGHVSGGASSSPPAPPSLVGADGHLQATSVTLGRWRTSYVLAASIGRPYNLSIAELGYHPSDELVVVEAHSPAHVRVVGAGVKLPVKACGTADFQLYTLAPVLANGWVLLGEPDKWVTVSRQRFSNLTLTNLTSGVNVTGGSGEQVIVHWRSPQGSLVRVDCTLAQSGTAMMSVGEGRASCI
jgi:hypothetical protein